MFDLGFVSTVKYLMAAWHSVAWLGVGGLVVITCAVVAFLRPTYAYFASIVGVVALGLTIFYGMGVRDAVRMKEQQAEIARQAAIAAAAQVRKEAEEKIKKQVEDETRALKESVGSGGSTKRRPTRRVPNDRYNRDRH